MREKQKERYGIKTTSSQNIIQLCVDLIVYRILDVMS